jgi:prepilin-type processing-associated H-X9-DG protein
MHKSLDIPPKATLSRLTAFTLVELLVVIGIIAVLISILLPSLSRAREQANRTACLSGLRSMGQVLQIYATDYKGRVPIGYYGQKHDGYMVYDQTRDAIVGILYKNDYLISPKAFFCKSQTDERWAYNSSANIFPPPAGLQTRLGQTLRPEVLFGANNSVGVFDGTIPAVSTFDSPEFRGSFPTLSGLRKRAIAAEMFGEPHNGAAGQVTPIILNHRDVINVLFADGSAYPIRTNLVDPGDNLSINDLLGQLAALNAVPTGQQMCDIYLDENSTPNHGIWYKFDQTHQ